MSTQDYNSFKYINLDESLKHLGFTDAQITSMTSTVRERYLNWTKEANNNVEADLFTHSDSIPLKDGSKEKTFARNAALNWVTYKKRDYDGSKNASASKNDYDRDIALAKEMLKKTPTTRMFPIETLNTDSTADIIIPYSQSQGFPKDILY